MMKLPFTLGTDQLLFRLVLPGLILASLLWPAVVSVDGASVDPLLYLPAVALLAGWMLGLCDAQIYMLYEGRRYWPMWLRCWGLRREQRRLRRLEASAEAARVSGDRQRFLEACSDIARFPLAPDGERHAAMPTRLGNLMYEYELYPSCKYGLDSVFFFYRIWVSVDKDLRDEIDRKQASVDGAVYLSFVLALGAVWFFLWFSIVAAADASGQSVQSLSGWLLRSQGRVELAWALPMWVTLQASAVCLVLAYAVYRLCLHAHAQYGEFYKALFDQHRTRLQHQDLLAYLAEATGDPNLGAGDFKQANTAVWRYLRWHKVRLSGQDENRNLEAILRERGEPGGPAAVQSARAGPRGPRAAAAQSRGPIATPLTLPSARASAGT